MKAPLAFLLLCIWVCILRKLCQNLASSSITLHSQPHPPHPTTLHLIFGAYDAGTLRYKWKCFCKWFDIKSFKGRSVGWLRLVSAECLGWQPWHHDYIITLWLYRHVCRHVCVWLLWTVTIVVHTHLNLSLQHRTRWSNDSLPISYFKYVIGCFPSPVAPSKLTILWLQS